MDKAGNGVLTHQQAGAAVGSQWPEFSSNQIRASYVFTTAFRTHRAFYIIRKQQTHLQACFRSTCILGSVSDRLLCGDT